MATGSLKRCRPASWDYSEDELEESLEEHSLSAAKSWTSGKRASQILESMADEITTVSKMQSTEEMDTSSEATHFMRHLHKIEQHPDCVEWPVNVKDYLPTFPHPLDALFQRRLSSKREFAMLHSEAGEKIADGDLFSQQKFVRLFLSHYHRLFLVSEPGTGKTCSVVAFCEMVVRMKKHQIEHSLTNIKKFIILVKSTFHAQNIKKMIDQVCSGGLYRNTGSSKGARQPKRRSGIAPENADRERRAAYKMIADAKYKVVTYKTFAKSLRVNYLDTSPPKMQALVKEFSDTVLWVDEAHNVALKQSQLSNRKSTEKEDTYWSLHKLAHSAERMVLILSTATPMLNQAGEIVSLVNLLRNEDGAPPCDWNWRVTDDDTFEFRFDAAEHQLSKRHSPSRKVIPHFVGQMSHKVDVLSLSERQLEHHFRGLFMYSRQDPVGVKVNYVGQVGQVNQRDQVSRSSLPGKRSGNMKLSSSTMSRTQSEEKVYVGVQDNNYFFQLSRNVSNFVFPDNKSIKDGFACNMLRANDDTYRATPDFASYLSSMSNIKESSCKFHNIVHLCKTEPGNCFVYSEHVQGGGLYVLAACLEAQGFRRYTSHESVVSPSTGDVMEPLASSEHLRYVIFTADTQNNFHNIMELMNCKANAEGRYIKVFISSKIGREGISIKNVQQIHMIGPEWTSSGIFQATSRGIRAKAHQDLKEIIRARKGLGEEDEVNVEVRVFLHCAVSLNNNSIDRNMYFAACREERRGHTEGAHAGQEGCSKLSDRLPQECMGI